MYTYMYAHYAYKMFINVHTITCIEDLLYTNPKLHCNIQYILKIDFFFSIN